MLYKHILLITFLDVPGGGYAYSKMVSSIAI